MSSRTVESPRVTAAKEKVRRAGMRLLWTLILLVNLFYTSYIFYHPAGRPEGMTTGDCMIAEAIFLVGSALFLTRE